MEISHVQQHIAPHGASPQSLDQFTALLDEKEYRDSVSAFPDQDAVRLVEYLDSVRTPYRHVALAF